MEHIALAYAPITSSLVPPQEPQANPKKGVTWGGVQQIDDTGAQAKVRVGSRPKPTFRAPPPASDTDSSATSGTFSSDEPAEPRAANANFRDEELLALLSRGRRLC